MALRAVTPTLEDLSRKVFDLLTEQLGREPLPDRAQERGLLALALDAGRTWLREIQTPPLGSEARAREVTALHIVDQLQRLLDRLAQLERVVTLRRDRDLHERARETRLALAPGMVSGSHLGTLAGRLGEARRSYRAETLARASADEIEPNDAQALLDSYRWLERVTYHAWRIAHHLEQLSREAAPLPEVEPPEPD